MSDQGYVNKTIKEGVGEIEFFHPKSNSLPSVLLKELSESIQEFGSNNEVTVIHLKSGGDKAFCAGASFDELLSINNKEEGQSFFSGFANVILAIKNAPKFVVTQVQGKVVGGGVGIVCASDYVIALDSASVKLSELSIGIGPFVIGPAVERKIGVGAFSSLTINATEWKSGSWAESVGMYSKIVDSKEALNSEIYTLLYRLSKSSPQATQEIKGMLWGNTENWKEEMSFRAKQSGELVLSDFTKETLSAFKKK